jgi:hypothetical protein
LRIALPIVLLVGFMIEFARTNGCARRTCNSQCERRLAHTMKDIPMADDDRDFIERAESVTSKLYGEPASVEQIADNFALYGLRKRAATLESLDTELRGEIGSGSHSLRRHAQLMALRQKMGGVHAALRKAKR